MRVMKLSICISISVSSQACVHDGHGLTASAGGYLIKEDKQVTQIMSHPGQRGRMKLSGSVKSPTMQAFSIMHLPEFHYDFLFQEERRELQFIQAGLATYSHSEMYPMNDECTPFPFGSRSCNERRIITKTQLVWQKIPRVTFSVCLQPLPKHQPILYVESHGLYLKNSKNSFLILVKNYYVFSL